MLACVLACVFVWLRVCDGVGVDGMVYVCMCICVVIVSCVRICTRSCLRE